MLYVKIMSIHSIVILFVANYIFANADDFINVWNSGFASQDDTGLPLFLTPYIKNGEIENARKMSRVGVLQDLPYIPSYSGFLTVNKEYNSNIFFWFFPATNNDMTSPLILWLQGGPGASGLLGLFVENGPYEVYANNTAGLREIPWTRNFHMIYVDNPVQSGFSFTDDEKGYSTNQEEIVDNLYEFLQQFFTIFYEYRRNDFYIAGESYAGKHVPSLAYRIHTIGPSSQINLKGVAIGNGFSHPEMIIHYSEYYYQLGLLDRHQASIVGNLSLDVQQHIQNGEFEKALLEVSQIISELAPVIKLESYLKKFAGYNFNYNVLIYDPPEEYEYFKRYIQLPQFRKATHVGNAVFREEDIVKQYLRSDIMKSVKDEVAVLMNNYKVMFYNGQLDLAVPYTPTMNFLRSIQWKHAKEYQTVERQIWQINRDEEMAGYIHNVGDFYHVLVLGAGHLVPLDKPRAGYDLITRFISGTLLS